MGKIGEWSKEVQTSNHIISHGDEEYSTGSIVSNIIITLYGKYNDSDEHFVMYMIKSLNYTIY